METKREKKYLIDNEKLMSEWNWEKNNELGLNPNILTYGSDKKVWWVCNSCNHEWSTSVGNRASLGRNCPNCAKLNKKRDVLNAKLKKYGSLYDNYKNLINEWDYDKNDKSPKEYLSHSAERVWWKCSKCNFEWKSKICHRVEGSGCPQCGIEVAITNRQNSLLKENKSFAESFPNLLNEWCFKKNKNINPNKILPMSGYKVWWNCKKGHEWQAVVSSRTQGAGCPQCQKELHTSFPEKCVYYYIKKYFDDAKENYKHEKLGKMEFDIFIPSLNVGIEYDGNHWHKNSNKDISKNNICEVEKINLYRIRETGCPIDLTNYNYVHYLQLENNSNLELSKKIEYLLNELNVKNFEINIEQDSIRIYELLEMSEKNNSIAVKKPNLIEEWNYNRNGNIKPEYLNFKSNKKVWWKCLKCSYEWQANVYSRTSGTGCPYCAGQIIIAGINDLLTTHKELCKEWNYKKNLTITPQEVSKGSKNKVWWLCNNGHEWQSAIYSRVKGVGCPICSGQKVLVGYNDLTTTNPNLCRDWNYNKNKLEPKNFSKGAKEKVWWVCDYGHEWQATISSRVRGNGCPICNGKQVLQGYNDLKTTFPLLAEEWDYSKNLKSPTEIVSGDYKVWWICKYGHNFESSIVRRKQGQGCPYCAGKKVLEGFNDLYTTNKELCEEWDYSRNTLYSPKNITNGSQKKVWWICKKCSHSWLSSIKNRTSGNGCPVCSGQAIKIGFNDLLTTNKELCAEWHYTLNKDINPQQFTNGSAKKVWWTCKNGHEWQARISSRVGGTGCPICYKERRKKNSNS